MPEDYSAWLGRVEEADDAIAAWPVQVLHALLNHQPASGAPGQPIPEAAHWLFFRTLTRLCDLGSDGHPHRGGFLPPVSLPRRMWAGGTLSFERPLRIGDTVHRRSEIARIEAKEGRSGPLVFITVRHQISGHGEPAIAEEQHLVYRNAPDRKAAAPPREAAPENALWRREVTPDAVLLFRYSALTYNAHRIHYDRTFATEVEGYPGLVVHGPLLATLLLDLCREHAGRRITGFQYRAQGPLFDTDPFIVAGVPAPNGAGCDLWAASMDGWLAMTAHADLEGI